MSGVKPSVGTDASRARAQHDHWALSLRARRADKAASENKRIMTLQRELAVAEDRLKRLYHLVEDELTELDDVLKEWLGRLKATVTAPKLASMQRNLRMGRQSASIQP
jgi:hypothetical protein